MTARMAATLLAVNFANATGAWFRARNAGDRVSLAYLVDHRRLVRRPWRGDGLSRDSAFEYANPVYVDRGIVSTNGLEQRRR